MRSLLETATGLAIQLFGLKILLSSSHLHDETSSGCPEAAAQGYPFVAVYARSAKCLLALLAEAAVPGQLVERTLHDTGLSWRTLTTWQVGSPRDLSTAGNALPSPAPPPAPAKRARLDYSTHYAKLDEIQAAQAEPLKLCPAALPAQPQPPSPRPPRPCARAEDDEAYKDAQIEEMLQQREDERDPWYNMVDEGLGYDAECCATLTRGPGLVIVIAKTGPRIKAVSSAIASVHRDSGTNHPLMSRKTSARLSQLGLAPLRGQMISIGLGIFISEPFGPCHLTTDLSARETLAVLAQYSDGVRYEFDQLAATMFEHADAAPDLFAPSPSYAAVAAIVYEMRKEIRNSRPAKLWQRPTFQNRSSMPEPAGSAKSKSLQYTLKIEQAASLIERTAHAIWHAMNDFIAAKAEILNEAVYDAFVSFRRQGEGKAAFVADRSTWDISDMTWFLERAAD
ncbi:hypothetical protein BDZ88DRAFT_507814 [Geranomyces variabilis]|nr:hypothetical protein BDZ88DRAFT_507814 [Geranomyces variabilis]KAJ3138400.1 hypothetical protein HDU90_001364 [Geranomyces variabilis]